MCKRIFILIMSFCTCVPTCDAMAPFSKRPLRVYVVAGLGDTAYGAVRYVQHYMQEPLQRYRNAVTFVGIEPPQSTDLGQTNCMHQIEEALAENNEDFIMVGISQGGAASLNYFAAHPEQRKHLKALILESSVATSNSAVCHRVSTLPIVGLIHYLPFSDSWLPHMARIAFPSYKPFGKYEALRSVENFPNTIPVVIVHSTNDPVCPYEGATALYHALRATGNKSAYLVQCQWKRHVGTLAEHLDGGVIAAENVCAILAHHGVIGHECAPHNFDRFQPDPKKSTGTYDKLMKALGATNGYRFFNQNFWVTLCAVSLCACTGHI